jgi:hypothetical protein
VDGQGITDAVFDTLDAVKQMPGVMIPINEVPDVPVSEVSVSGEIIELWWPSSSAISQVGLIADESGKIKFTSWSKSDQKWVREGDQVQIKYAKKNWYRGRCSIALTYVSRIAFPEHDRRWWLNSAHRHERSRQPTVSTCPIRMRPWMPIDPMTRSHQQSPRPSRKISVTQPASTRRCPIRDLCSTLRIY